jgi:hypothetical protein
MCFCFPYPDKRTELAECSSYNLVPSLLPLLHIKYCLFTSPRHLVIDKICLEQKKSGVNQAGREVKTRPTFMVNTIHDFRMRLFINI